MKFLNLTDNRVEDEITQLKWEIDEIRHRLDTWALNLSDIDFWTPVVERMELRLNALQAGIDARVSE